MNLGDPELELIDPTPNIFALFVNFDKIFFSNALASRAVVRWSKKMYSCAGICSYEGRGGLCDIALSEPLLKLRPRKDLVETLLHEMIHAYLFVTRRDQDRDGHGPNFQMHMHRINRAAGLNISIYHDFHDEVKLYLTHWWRCNGPCQQRRPYFGIVRRQVNRPPGPSDFWWKDHLRSCGGTYTKIKEPENTKITRKKPPPKSKGDITKYITSDKTNKKVPTQKPVLKPKNLNTITKPNSANTVVVTKKVVVYHPTTPKVTNSPIQVFSGAGKKISSDFNSNEIADVKEKVRNIWANKNLPVAINKPERNNKKANKRNLDSPKTSKTKATSPIESPPMKMKKINDYFKTNAEIVLKDLYGKDFKVTESVTSNKLVAVPSIAAKMVPCPICNSHVSDTEINRHLDECLNKEEIDKLTQVYSYVDNTRTTIHPKLEKPRVDDKPAPNLLDTVDLSIIDHVPIKHVAGMVDLTNIERTETNIRINNVDSKATTSRVTFDPVDIAKVESIVKKIKYDKHIRKSDNFVVAKDEKTSDVDFGYLPSFLDDNAVAIDIPPVRIEPGTSRNTADVIDKKCPCCGKSIDKPIEQHLDECLAFDNDTTLHGEGASTSFGNETVILDDDEDIFDETQTMNETGTKAPCPCCLNMVEEADMNMHLDICLK